jgi:hypothetical protein
MISARVTRKPATRTLAAARCVALLPLHRLGDGGGQLTTAEQWDETRAFIAVSGLLCGPRGDSGYAAFEAHRIAHEYGMGLTVEAGTARIHADGV